jgi:hypothetical protein
MDPDDGIGTRSTLDGGKVTSQLPRSPVFQADQKYPSDVLCASETVCCTPAWTILWKPFRVILGCSSVVFRLTSPRLPLLQSQTEGALVIEHFAYETGAMEVGPKNTNYSRRDCSVSVTSTRYGPR